MPNFVRKWTVRDVPLQTYKNAFELSTLRLILSVLKSSAPSNNSIHQLRPLPLGLRQRPYDSPLQKIPCCHQPLWMRCWLTCHVASSWSEQVSAQRPPEQLHVSNASEMVLRPAVVPTGEKILRIVVFIDSIIPRDEVHVLSNIGITNRARGATLKMGGAENTFSSVTLYNFQKSGGRLKPPQPLPLRGP